MPYKIIRMLDNANAEGGKQKADYLTDDILNWIVPIRERRGTSDKHLVISTSGISFIEYRFECSASGGDNRGIYNRLYFTVAGASGESLRSYTDVVGVALGSAHGAHISLGFGESTTKGSVTGQGVAVRATLAFPDVAMAAGASYAVILAEMWSFGTSSTPAAVTKLAFFQVSFGGSTNGKTACEDKAYLFRFGGGSAASSNMIGAAGDEPTWTSNKTYQIRCDMYGTDIFLIAVKA